MGDLLSIRIKIGDREYPMRVPPEEEERLRIAGRLINERIKHYREKFGLDDKQDLLAMVAFDSLVEKLRSDAQSSGHNSEVSSKISSLESLLAKHLSEE